LMKTNKSYLKFRFAKQEQHLSVQNSHTARAVIAAFDGGNLVLVAGLVLVMKSAEKTGLRKLADKWLNAPAEKGGSRMPNKGRFNGRRHDRRCGLHQPHEDPMSR